MRRAFSPKWALSPKWAIPALAASLLLACAGQPDHFYTLNTLPAGPRGALSAPATHVILSVTIPALVDRAEMVLGTTENAIRILDHERWAVSLSDQVAQTLARDIEQRRTDVLIGDSGFDRAATPPVMVRVDLVRMSARRAGRVSIEAHWRIVSGRAEDGAGGDASDQIGGDVFESSADEDYASVAAAYSRTLSDLAERLAAMLPRQP